MSNLASLGRIVLLRVSILGYEMSYYLGMCLKRFGKLRFP